MGTSFPVPCLPASVLALAHWPVCVNHSVADG